jgi:uncharacterized protein
MNQAFHLYRLQLIDSQISQVESQLKEIDRLLAANDAVRQAQMEVDQKHKVVLKTSQTLKEIEFSVREQTLKIEQCESALYSGKVRNPKELQDLTKEIASLKKHLSQLEDRQIESMVAVEEAEEASTAAQKLYAQVQADFLEKSAGWSGKRDLLMKNMERLEAERSPALSYITQESLDVYNRLRQRKNGVGVATVSDGSCSVCGGTIRPSEVQAARQSPTTLAYCSSCGRILYAG